MLLHQYFSVTQHLKITLLGSGWSSSKGGLSTFNRELAIQLSEHAKADVSLLVPEGACESQEIIEAISFGITVVEAKGRAAYDRLDWLSTPPKDHNMEIVVGHGVKLGRQVQFIRDSARFPNCKWVQVVHTAPEDLGRFKSYTEPISKGQRKHQDEVELCKLADLVVPVGPRLKNFYSSYLRRHKTDQDVFTVTPGLFDREFEDLVEKQKPYEDGEFKVLLFGRGDDEDFELKGYNIAAQAFSDPRMKEDFCLMFVGAPQGKVDEVTQRLLQYGIANDHLYVREFIAEREGIKDILCEADLAIMPSKSEGFGLVGLEALSAGLPILVGSRSGFAKALEKVPSGKSFIVYSDDPTMWADAIVSVRDKHKSRLDEIKALRESYGQIYSWRSQCKDLAKVMQKMIQGMMIFFVLEFAKSGYDPFPTKPTTKTSNKQTVSNTSSCRHVSVKMFTDGCVQSIFLHSSGYSDTDVDMTEKDKHNSDTERRMYQDRLYEPCERPMKLRSHQKSESDDGVTTRLSDPDQRSGKTSGRIPMLTSRKGKALHYS